MPMVSICVPTYNQAQFLGEALDSASSQRFDDLEIIVVDNASCDDTPRVAAAAAARDPRIRCFRHPENIGLIGNFNACMRLARGEYIKFLCSDDFLEPDCVPVLCDVLTRQPGVSLVACGRSITDENLVPRRVVSARTSSKTIPGPEMIAECFFMGNRIGEPTAVMFRRSDSTRGFCVRYHQLLDMEMWFHLMQAGDFHTLPQPLCRVRRHSAQATWINDKGGRIVDERKLLYAEFASLTASYASLRRRCVWDFRMAYALARSETAGCTAGDCTFGEVYFPRTFRRFTRPMVRLMMAAGLERFRAPG